MGDGDEGAGVFGVRHNVEFAVLFEEEDASVAAAERFDLLGVNF